MTTTDTAFETINAAKANFDSIYNEPDPREYFRVLCGLDYLIPELAKGAIRSIIDARQRRTGRAIKVLDLGCSYGINAALQKYPIDIQRLAQRYASLQMQKLASSALCQLDASYFSSWPLQSDAMMIGADTSQRAVAYALRAGLIDAGICRNLEIEEPTEREAALLRGTGLIMSTGCIGYVTERTLRKVLSLQSKEMPWVANFVLRMFPYEPIADALAEFGLVTEKLEGITFVQRRFHSKDEFLSTLDTLEELGIDPVGKESEGLLHAELYVSRPAADVEEVPLDDIVSVTSGACYSFGRRFARISPASAKLMP
jgi:hypothetical protein